MGASKLGIVAGGGPLPGYIAARCREQGRDVFIVAIEHHAEPAVVEGFPHVWVRLGAGGEAIRCLHEAAVEEVVLAGPVRRPTLAELRPDARTARFLAKGVLKAGDDGLLGSIVRLLEDEEGFRVVGAHDIAGGLLARRGRLGRHGARDDDRSDVDRGREVLVALGPLDVAQAVVVQAGVVLGVEAVEGTDALIERTGALRLEGKGPVLVKLAKRGQERRVDLPTIGPRTVELCRRAGFAGIAVEAGGCLVFEHEAVVRAADEAGLFLEGIDARAE